MGLVHASGVASLPIRVVTKTTDQTVNNSVTLVNDDELKMSMGASEVWFFWLFLRYNSSTVADLDFAFTVPTGGSVSLVRTFATPVLFDGTGETTIDGAGSNREWLCTGLYIGGSTAGDLQLQWAQNTAEVSDSKMLTNSCIIGIQLA